MSRLDVRTADGRLEFPPGEELRGTASWSLDAPPESVELRLFWRTEGKGDQNVGIAETLRFDGAGAVDQRDFRLRVPAGPYSCSGKLISLIWAVEVVAEPGAEAGRVDITVSPTGRAIVLGSVPTDGTP